MILALGATAFGLYDVLFPSLFLPKGQLWLSRIMGSCQYNTEPRIPINDMELVPHLVEAKRQISGDRLLSSDLAKSRLDTCWGQLIPSRGKGKDACRT